MDSLISLALELQEFCEARSWRYCVIGGVAVQHWGESRLTQDVDLTLLTGFGGEEAYVDELLSCYAGRLRDTRSFALQNRVLLLKSNSGIGIDVALGALPFEEEVIARSVKVEMRPGASLRLCSASDLVVMKAFASRPVDWADLRGILVRSEGVLEWPYIEAHLGLLCEVKEEPEIVERLLRLRAEVQRP